MWLDLILTRRRGLYSLLKKKKKKQRKKLHKFLFSCFHAVLVFLVGSRFFPARYNYVLSSSRKCKRRWRDGPCWEYHWKLRQGGKIKSLSSPWRKCFFLNILNLLFPLCLLARLLPLHCPASVKTFQLRGLFRLGSVHFPPLVQMTSPDICYPVSFFSPSQLPTPIHSDKNPLHLILAN